MDQLKTLLWLKWRLTVRAYGRFPSRILGLVFIVLIMGVTSVAIGGACFVGFVKLPELVATELLHIVLLGLWCFWLFMPVLGFPLGESYDITKQLVFPIPRMRMFIASILSSAMGAPIVFLLPVLGAIIIGFSLRSDVGRVVSTLAGALAALVLALFVVHILSLGQTLLIMLLGVLRSRRYQDIITIFLPFIGVALYLGFHLIARSADRDAISYRAILEAQPSRYLVYTPSGLAAKAIDAASYGEYGRFLLFAALLAGVTGVVLWLGGHLMQRVYAGEIIDSRRLRRPRTAPARVAAEEPIPRWLRLVPPALLAVTVKELRYLWRDPQMKSALLGLGLPVVYLLVVMQGPWQLKGLLMDVMPALVGLMFVYAGAPLLMNIFGYDREGLNILFLFPSDRRLLLIGKNILGLVILVSASSIGLIAAAAWMKQLGAVATTLPFLVAVSFVTVAGGNVASVYFPVRVVGRGENPFSQSTEKGCIIHIVRALVFQVMLLASVPIVAGFLTPHFLDLPALYLLTAPISIVYGAAVYVIVLPYAASALLQRETRLIEICTASEE